MEWLPQITSHNKRLCKKNKKRLKVSMSIPKYGCHKNPYWKKREAKMNEWILILVINLVTNKGEIRDVSIETIKGFNTKESCEIASNKFGYELIRTIGKARNQQGIPKGNNKSMPMINSNCILIAK